jgi:hypothetical protein
VTATRPRDTEPNWAKVGSARSTIRPETNGPRETTLQFTDTPPRLVTVMVAPIGAELLAQVPAGIVFNQLATPATPPVAATWGMAFGVAASTGGRGASMIANVGGPDAGGTVVGGTVVGGTVIGGNVLVGTTMVGDPPTLDTVGAMTGTPTAAEPAIHASDRASAMPGVTADIPTSDNAQAATVWEPNAAGVSTGSPGRWAAGARRVVADALVTIDTAGITAKLPQTPRIMSPRSRLPSMTFVRSVSPLR